jgi:DNA-binding transcriptional regulator YhcF (GntR family)
LLDRQIIENQRGLGYFVAAEARRRIVDELKAEFVRNELPRVFRTMRVLDMSVADLEPHFARFNGEAIS